MAMHRRNVIKLGAAIVVALSLSLSAPLLLAQSGKVEVLWLGQATFKITTPGGKVIVTDPFLSGNPKTPAEYKDLAKLGKVDLILISHGHGDHVGTLGRTDGGSDAADLAKLTGAKVYGPAGLIQTMIELGWVTAEQGVRFGKGGKVQPLGPQITITQVRAEHSSEVTVTDPATKKSTTHPGGEPAGFIIQMENGFKIYHMGDTGLFGDMKLIADYYKPDLVLMPIGGHFVMDPQDAAYATKEWLKPKFVIPMHYGTFPVLKGTPQEYIAALGQTTTKVFAINPGDKLEF
jgi:L-ascorbate metabolism protein UlaG (beta-lactamase superfamily)